MKRPTKFVKPLTAEQREKLTEIMKTDANHWRRVRAHAVLLSDRKYPLDQIADIYQVDRDRVSQWLDWWETDQEAGLDDDPRSGRPPKLNETQQQQVLELVEEDPRSLRTAVTRITELWQVTVSSATVRRIVERAGWVWKRMRRSLRDRRDPEAFAVAKAELARWKEIAQAPQAEFDLWYFDEAGFTLTPSLPYAWQPAGQTWELASASHQQRQNVLGFLNLRHDFHSYAFSDRIDTQTVIACFEDFRRHLTKPTVVVLDNAPIHVNDDFQDALDEWHDAGLYLYFLPPYSPELNLIENLWRFIKYQWLPLSAFESFETLTTALFSVLAGIGSKYRITFV